MPRLALRQYPPTIQLFIFMIIWLVCQLLCAGIIIPGILKAVSGTDTALTAFQEQPGAFPSAAIWINFSGAMLLFLLPALVFAIILSQKPLAFVGLKKTTLKLLPWTVLAGIAMIFVLPGISGWLKSRQQEMFFYEVS